LQMTAGMRLERIMPVRRMGKRYQTSPWLPSNAPSAMLLFSAMPFIGRRPQCMGKARGAC